MNEYFCLPCDEKFNAVGEGWELCPHCQRHSKKVMSITRFLLRDYRKPTIKVKERIIKYLVLLVKKFKIEPTKENTKKPLTHVFIDIFDKFERYEKNPTREPMFHAIRNLFLNEVEHDDYYEDRILVFIEDIVEAVLDGKIKPRAFNHPYFAYWREPLDEKARGKGYFFIKEKYRERV